MCPLRLVALRICFVAVCVVVPVTVLVAGAPASSAQPTAGTPFTLVAPGPCTAPAKVVGRACAVIKNATGWFGAWTMNDGTARWDNPGFQASYTWKIPATIPPSGATLTMTATAKELTGNSRICPQIGVAPGDFSVKAGQNPALAFCAEAGESKSASRSLTLVPPSSPPGTVLYLLIGIQDGGQYVYKYKAAAENRCRKPSAVGQTPECKYKVSWVFTQGGRRPAGMPEWVTDVLTAGRGSGEVDGIDGSQNLEKFNTRVVRTMEIAKPDPDTGITIEDVTLRFVATPDRGAKFGPASTGGFAVSIPLELIGSDDPLCARDRRNGSARTGSLLLVDGRDTGKDLVSLSVAGCPHHSAIFRGSVGPKSAVKVAIVVKPA